MNKIHEANRACWNEWAQWWGERRDKKGVWNKCHRDPTLVLSPGEMHFLSNVRNKDVCVLGSGDNEVVFALAGMGAKVTSVDISEGQLEIAERRARTLGFEVSLLRADVTDLEPLRDHMFDVVCTGGCVSVWISDIRKFYAEGVRILKPGGLFIVNEFHPFGTLLNDQSEQPRLRSSYLDRGPIAYTTNEGRPQFEYRWTVADHIQAVLGAGCDLLKVDEHVGTVGDRIQDALDAGCDPSEIDALLKAHEDGEEPHDSLPADIRLPRYLLIVGRKHSSNNALDTDAQLRGGT